MLKDNTKGSDGFEPPKYLASLIAAINDGAKAAQGGALFFALVGVYLLATAFSASDEDLLRGRTVAISQIGATLPVGFSFAIAPFVFVFLHIYTLARYYMLATNVRQFLEELDRTVPLETDRERCRQLLANVEFIQALVAPRGSRLYSRVWRWLVRAVIAGFPVFVLLLVQMNALRYQSALITRVQQLVLLVELFALFWFSHRNPLKRPALQPGRRSMRIWRWACLLGLPATVMVLNVVYLSPAPAGADPYLVRSSKVDLAHAASYPLDAVLCPLLQWGCRYLRVDHRTLVDHVWDDKAIVELRSGSSEKAKALAAVEGLVLRDRSFRFAALDESSLFAADLTGADLRKASLHNAALPEAKLAMARLEGVDLTKAQLEGADLSNAQLQGANLDGAQLQGATLSGAQLQGAALAFAQLQGADLSSTEFQGAQLGGARLQGAIFSLTHLGGRMA